MAALRPAFSMLLAVGTVALGAAPPASAEMISRVGVVTTLDGTATLSRVALPQGVPLKIRDDVFVADRIVTGDKSFARILLGGKAIVTVRERSVLNITEAPGTSTVDVSIGRVAVAVVKERMKPGESVEIRTPNAVAGIRGTVVVAEVDQATSQLGATSGGFTTTITVLKGRIEFRQLDRLTRQPTGPGVAVGALQSVRVTGFAVPRPVQKVPSDVQQQLINDFRVPLRTASATTNSAMAEGQMRQAVSAAGAQLGALNTATPDAPAPAKSEDGQGANGKSSDDNQGSDGKSSGDKEGSNKKSSGDTQSRNGKKSDDDQGSNKKSSGDTPSGNARNSDNNQGPDEKSGGDTERRNSKNSDDNQGSNKKSSGDTQSRNARNSDDNQGPDEKSGKSGSTQSRSGNTNASGNSSPSGNSGSTGSGGTSPVASGGGGGSPAGSAPAAAPATSTGTSSAPKVTTAAPPVSTPAPSSAPVVSAPPVAAPTASAGTPSARSAPVTAPVVSAPAAPTVTAPPAQNIQGMKETSLRGAVQKAIEKASKAKSKK